MTTRCYGHAQRQKNAKLKTIKDFLKQKHNCFFFKKNTHTSTRVTLNGQITLYLYIVSRVAKNCVLCVKPLQENISFSSYENNDIRELRNHNLFDGDHHL